MPEMTVDPAQAFRSMQHVYDAAGRAASRGLGSDADGERGLNADGMQVLADLATVMMMQASQGSQSERVLSGTCRALLSAQAAVIAEMSGESADPHLALAMQALAGALREARA